MIDIQYQELLETILTKGHDKGGRNGGTKSIFSAQIEHDMTEGFPLLTTKKMAWHQVRTEFLWMIKGLTNIRWLVRNRNHIWVGDCYKAYRKHCKQMIDDPNETMRKLGVSEYDHPLTRKQFINKIMTNVYFAAKWGDLGPIYGHQFRTLDEVDQLENALAMLRSNPESRRNVVNAWNVEQIEQMKLPPCHFAFKFYTRPLAQWERLESIGVVLAGTAVQSSEKYRKLLEERGVPKYALSLKWYQRSVDVPLGLPFNIAFYAIMLEVYARMANMVPETLIGDLTDVHIYNDQLDGVYDQLGRSPKGCSPQLMLPESDTLFKGNITNFTNSIKPEDFHIEGYECHPKIKFPLSN